MSDAAAWFETVGERTVHDGYGTVVVETVRTPDGDLVEREVVRHADAVAVVAVTDRDEVLLLRQYRQPLRGHLLEIPAGKMDVDGESPEDAARRELIEETGHDAAELTHLVTFYNSAGWCTERTHTFLARRLRPVRPPDGYVAGAEEAVMEIVPFTFDDAIEAARSGQLSDGKTVVGLLLAAARLGR